MEFLAELLKGVILAVGVILGLLICAAFIYNKLKSASPYGPEDLIKPFQDYQSLISWREQYEDIQGVFEIVCKLQEGIIPDEIENYRIKEESHFLMNEMDGKMALRIQRTYTVLGKKPSPIKS